MAQHRAEDAEDDAYPIPRTPGEQAEYDQERLERARACEADQTDERRDDGCPSSQHLDAEGARARVCRVYDQIQPGRRETPVFPRASQNVTAAAMIMRTAPEPNAGPRILRAFWQTRRDGSSRP
jgi:hypothetical protein